VPDTDPGSLDRLHDIAVPDPVPFWPPAPGWWVVTAVGLVLLLVAVVVGIGRWRRNRYRREALAELERRTQSADIAELVKRAALAAFPRDRVAALTGDEWLAFLDETGRTDAFTRGAGKSLADAAYRRPTEAGDVRDLVAVVRHWIKHHRC
jgi:hypothetical protein